MLCSFIIISRQQAQGRMVSHVVVQQKFSMRWARHYYYITYVHSELYAMLIFLPNFKGRRDTRIRLLKYGSWALRTTL